MSECRRVYALCAAVAKSENWVRRRGKKWKGVEERGFSRQLYRAGNARRFYVEPTKVYYLQLGKESLCAGIWQKPIHDDSTLRSEKAGEH